MDGKLIKTCLIEGDIEDYQGQNIVLTPDTGSEKGSFDGFLAKFKKFEKAVTPRLAWSVYKEGYTKGGFLGVLNTFGLKMEVTKAGKTAVLRQGCFKLCVYTHGWAKQAGLGGSGEG